MSYSRNDPSSLSFGRRLSIAERDAADTKRELAELKLNLPDSADLKGAAMAADVIKQQRKSAKQLMARPDASLADLSAIDPSVLTPVFQEQLRHSKIDAGMREQLQQAQSLHIKDPAALQRLQNWQTASMTISQQQDFAAMNLAPAQETPFQRWDKRQKLLAGRKWNDMHNRAEYEKDINRARSHRQRNQKSQAKGRHIGKVS